MYTLNGKFYRSDTWKEKIIGEEKEHKENSEAVEFRYLWNAKEKHKLQRMDDFTWILSISCYNIADKQQFCSIHILFLFELRSFSTQKNAHDLLMFWNPFSMINCATCKFLWRTWHFKSLIVWLLQLSYLIIICDDVVRCQTGKFVGTQGNWTDFFSAIEFFGSLFPAIEDMRALICMQLMTFLPIIHSPFWICLNKTCDRSAPLKENLKFNVFILKKKKK